MSAVPAAAGTRTVGRRPLPEWAGSVIGIVSLLALWQLLAVTVFSDNGAVPPPTAIVSQMADDGWDFYQPNISTTAREAALGWLWGNLLAVGVAALFVILPITERPLMRLAIASYCLPIIAIGPILQIVFAGDAPKVILAALSVFFTTLIGALVGLRSADRTSLDLVHAYGGGGWAKLTKVRVWASLPSLFAGLRIAAPAAILGAIIGEYLGGESGLGIAMINSQQALQVERTWGIALVATGVASLAYGATALVGQLLTPWAPRSGRVRP
jgi:ABC-type nitrate/sulfonate/bicarbonate transport system permease component